MRLRSLLFVPGDRPERFDKAAASGADAVILDQEDAVVPAGKVAARAAVGAWLAQPPAGVRRFVRINPLAAGLLAANLAAAQSADALVLPKTKGAASVAAVQGGWTGACPPILPIATETPAAIF